jgi:two-component system, NarL family, nitrate/nitrite response regulator NarL
LRIIIADDQKHARNGLRALLLASLQAPAIWEAKNGLEAERLAEEVSPDVILMDLNMPQLNGLEATRRIKSRTPAVRIIVLSLDGSKGLAALAAGADNFFSKGENPDRLLAVIAPLPRQDA